MFAFQFQGCADIEPPEGAWLTRDGNNIEIGCHSGAKSWTMTCNDNQWTGSIGQCGKFCSPYFQKTIII